MARRRSKKGGCYGGGSSCQGGRRTRKAKMRGGTMAVGPASDQTIVGTLEVVPKNLSGPVSSEGRSAGDVGGVNEGAGYALYGGRRGSRRTRRVVKKKSVKAIRRLLKAKGLKSSGSKRALTARARKARIPMKGGNRSPLTGAPYHSYTGSGDAGLASKFVGSHPVSNNVVSLPGWGSGSSEFIQTGSGGLSSA